MTTEAELLISVVVPAYNYAETLPRAVRSVLSELTERHELIVIDDGSTDHTPQVLDQLHQEFPGAFRSVRKVNGGLASVRNRGVEEGHGDYLVFLDADDEMVPGALRALEKHLQQHPETRMVIGGYWSVWPDGKRRKQLPAALPDSPHARLRGYLLDKTIGIANGASAMHRDLFSRGLYPVHFRNAEDMPVFSQALANFPCSILPEPLAFIHKHGDSLRHNVKYDREVGVALVDEVFSSARLPEEFSYLRRSFMAQRCLSLFRGYLQAGDHASAKEMYCQALRMDWRAVLRFSYTRKALRLWLRG
ncbi:glycosyltransferase family 2 protein [Stutzerimonas nitrititolerans]|uniref:glycosyltransferase family 2 protein n=1 Tax=Stutzerimonas nitrititolerans TaxID=2482751 RepID=UPI0028991EBE|nr:glycosyltransferase family 2 protein [Stutzerimonas nitrititolerans]